MAYANLTKKAKRNFDAVVEAAIRQHCAGLQINILDIPKVFKAAVEAYDAGNADIVGVVVNKYRELAKGGA